MAAAWFSLKKSVKCTAELSDVQDPKETRKLCLCRSGCSRSIKDVIHGNTRHKDNSGKATVNVSRSVSSIDILNPIAHHHVLISDSKCELKVTQFSDKDGSSKFVVGSSKGINSSLSRPRRSLNGESRSFVCQICGEKFKEFDAIEVHHLSKHAVNYHVSSKFVVGSSKGINSSLSRPRRSLNGESRSFVCQICGEKFKEFVAIEVHHLSKHAVTALPERDSSKKIVELICQTTDFEPEDDFDQIERILKVNNMQTSLARFEDYREMVKDRANKLSKKHPRCLADGNELLRFYGTTVACSIGNMNSGGLCRSEKCGVCQILRNGFSTKDSNGFQGVFTSSSSERAFDGIELNEEKQNLRKALLVCRVIAGMLHKPVENLQEMAGRVSFDSLAGEVEIQSNKIEELFSLNPRALLPCFVVIFKSP